MSALLHTSYKASGPSRLAVSPRSAWHACKYNQTQRSPAVNGQLTNKFGMSMTNARKTQFPMNKLAVEAHACLQDMFAMLACCFCWARRRSSSNHSCSCRVTSCAQLTRRQSCGDGLACRKLGKGLLRCFLACMRVLRSPAVPTVPFAFHLHAWMPARSHGPDLQLRPGSEHQLSDVADDLFSQQFCFPCSVLTRYAGSIGHVLPMSRNRCVELAPAVRIGSA